MKKHLLWMPIIISGIRPEGIITGWGAMNWHLSANLSDRRTCARCSDPAAAETTLAAPAGAVVVPSHHRWWKNGAGVPDAAAYPVADDESMVLKAPRDEGAERPDRRPACCRMGDRQHLR